MKKALKLLLIDNYDSFTYNLYQYIGETLLNKGLAFAIDVFRNDAITLTEITKRQYDKIIISPGPGDPRDAAYFGVCSEVITDLGRTTPVLGVCLGMQGIASSWGGIIKNAVKPMHGKSSIIAHDEQGLFQGLPQQLDIMRYHSLVVDRKMLPDCLEITAVVASFRKGAGMDEGEIMGLRHKRYPVEGIQFHPESFATEGGKKLLENFLFRIN